MATGLDFLRIASPGNPPSTHDRLYNDANGTLNWRDSAGNSYPIVPPSLTAAVSGPGSSTDNALARWDGSTGRTLQNSAVILSDANDMTVPGQIFIDGDTDQRQLRVQAHSSQTFSLQTWESSAAGTLAQITNAGDLQLDRNAASARVDMNTYSNTQTDTPLWNVYRTRGTESAKLLVQNADYLGRIRSVSFDGTVDAEAASILIYAAENWSGGNHGSGMQFANVRYGQTALTTNLTLEDNQVRAENTFWHRGGTLSFYGNTGIARQTVSGSRMANAALDNLISAMTTLGLIFDATTI